MPWRRAGARASVVAVLLLAELSVPAVVPALAAADPKPAKPPAKTPARPRQTAAATTTCTHTVQNGESISRIAKRYGVTRDALVTASKLQHSEPLKRGQRLTVPGCERRVAKDAKTRETRQAAARRQGAIPAVHEPVPTNGTLIARVGPRRVPTQLMLGTPELTGRLIDFAWPVSGAIASGFGRRRSGWHAGIDIKADLGTPVLAAAPGTVVVSGWERAYGRVVKIEHAKGFVTIYAHNLQNFVQPGDQVGVGSVIAMVGRSGRSTAYHLHFEVRQDGIVYDPVHILPERDIVLVRSDEPMAETHTEEEEDEPASGGR